MVLFDHSKQFFVLCIIYFKLYATCLKQSLRKWNNSEQSINNNFIQCVLQQTTEFTRMSQKKLCNCLYTVYDIKGCNGLWSIKEYS